MLKLSKKIDFVMFITVKKANPNGDPLNGNRPRTDYEGFGEISDVCIKRKIRNRLIDFGEHVFVQSNDKRVDEFNSLKERAKSNVDLVKADKDGDEKGYARAACSEWIDVRSFGQLFAFAKDAKDKGKGVSIGIRGPVSIHTAVSIEPLTYSSMQITKSVNSEPTKDNGKSSDTMGMKHRVDFGVYRLQGSMNPQLAELTGFSDNDAETIKEALISLFENDASSARPEGSIEVNKIYWFEHSSKIGQYSSAKVHRSVDIRRKLDVVTPLSFDDYDCVVSELDGLHVNIYNGL
mgnify:CR=1 FL=1